MTKHTKLFSYKLTLLPDVFCFNNMDSYQEKGICVGYYNIISIAFSEENFIIISTITK